MDLEKLVEEITRTVLKELRRDESCDTILFFAKKDTPLPESLQNLVKDPNNVLYVDEDWKLDKIDRFILPCLHIDQMVDLALGKGGSKLMYEVREVLLTGKQIEVVEFEYRKYCASAPFALLKLYEQYHETLKGFGLVELQVTTEQAHRVMGGLVKESDVMEAKKNGAVSLEVAASCNVTPLAYDCAREQSIEIQKL